MRRIAAAMVAALLAFGGTAVAQSYPTRPMRLIVPFPAGGPSDVLARVLGQKISDDWGQQVVVDNRPGGNTIIGAELVAKAAPDGYTLLMPIDSTMVMNQYLYSKLPYDPFKDFTPITLTARSPVILEVDAKTGPKTVKDLIAQAKANPGKLTFGAGTIATQLAGELIKRDAGIDVVYVGYKGSAPTVEGLLSHEVNFILDGVTSGLPQIKAGSFRALATLGTSRVEALPDLRPLATEANLPGFDVAVWLGLVAPAGTPAAIVNKWQAEVAKIAKMPDVKAKLAAVGLETTSDTPAQFATFMHGEADRWSKIIKQVGLHLD